MNASCALQHFCDIHGPQILLCTEGRTYIPNSNDTDNEDLNTFYSQYIRSENSQAKFECKSCTISSESILVSTIDFVRNMLYISSASTPNQDLFKNIRNACVRSLTIERSVENNHPILFGDDENGYCLSLTFSCKDFHARGSQRLYSLCYLCHDKYYLISLMNIISNCMKETVYWLQNDANETYEQEGRIKVNTNVNQSTYICRPPPRVPLQRMLSDIVHDSKLIHRIHALFVWVLRTTNSAINESLFDALPTEEQTTKQERKELEVFDNESIVIKQRSETILERTTSHRSYLSSSIDNTNSLENMFDDDDDYDSLDYQFSTHAYEAFYLFKQFIQKLNNLSYLQILLSNWIIGNQLIIKYRNKTENIDYPRAFASIFRLFLPDGCCHLIETINEIESCTANFILIDMKSISTRLNFNDNHSTSIIDITFAKLDDNIRITDLEISPINQTDLIVPTYVKTIIEILMDNQLDEKVFESMIIQQKIKYLNKAKLYFQLGRCQIASVLSLSERQQMDILHVNNTADLSQIRFWQKGVSQTYKTQIRTLKQHENQQQKQQIKAKK